MVSEELKSHPFLTLVWKEAIQIQKNLKEDVLDIKFDTDIDEYQFYILRVGYSISHLITWLEQLEHAVHYLSNFSYSKNTKTIGINRAHHFIYNVENYLIRLQSIYDRTLQLTNNVFHLCIEESNISHSLIISNLKVSRTDIPKLLKSLRRSIDSKAQDRHAIIHKHSYQEKSLRRLELFYMFNQETWENRENSPSYEGLCHIRSQLMKEVVAEKKREYSEINKKICEVLYPLFTELHIHYDKFSAQLNKIAYG